MKNLDDVFDLEPFNRSEVISPMGEVTVPDQGSTDKNIDYDYEKTRSNLHSLLQQGQDALYHALELAKSTESVKDFEIVSNMMKNLVEVNHRLLDLSSKKKKISDETKKPEAPKQVSTTNNAIFVGSTADLNKLVQNMRGEKDVTPQE